MSQYNVIRDVSETLTSLLDDNLASSGSIEVSATSPQRVSLSTDHRLNLYLYQVSENPYAKNKGPVLRGPRRHERAPLALNLYYMLTPYVPDTEDNLDEHLILGDAMRILYDNPVVTDPLLRGGLRGSGAEIKVVLCSLNLEEQTRIWNSLQISYRLSVCYEVRVALIDSQNIWNISRVETQETLYGQR